MRSTPETERREVSDARAARHDARHDPAGAQRRMAQAGPPPTVHDATVSFLNQPGAHSTAEDLHPSALDPFQADLQGALARKDLEERNAERDARDA